MGLTYPKPTDLSHLVDSRIGIPEADPVSKISNGDFVNWTAGNPDDWAVSGTVNAANYVEEPSEGIRIVSDGTYIAITQDSFIGGKEYYIEINVISLIGGPLRITDTGNLDEFISFAGIYYYIFTSDGSSPNITITRKTAGQAMDVIIDYVISKEHNGEELVPDADVGFVANDATKWDISGTTLKEQDGSAVKTTYVDTANASSISLNTSKGTVFNSLAVVGNKYRTTYRIKVSSGANVRMRMYCGDTIYADAVTSTEWIVQSIDWTYVSTALYLGVSSLSAGESVWVEVLSTQKITGLVAAYNMIPSGETLVDISGDGYNGTIVGPVSSVDGMKFNGSSDYVDCGGNSINLGNIFTLYFRIKKGESKTTFGSVFSKQSSSSRPTFDIYIDQATGKFLAWFASQPGSFRSVTSTTIAENGKEYDIVISINGIITKLYVNGVLEDTDTTDLTLNWDVSYPLEIGRSRYTGGQYMGGIVIDVGLLNYAFNEQQAKDYHAQWANRISQRHAFDDLGVGSTI